MSTPDPTAPTQQVITPLESSYIRAVIPAILPAINWVIYATNLDQLLHITALTTNQVWQGINSVLMVLSVYLMIRKRIKDGNDPNSTARKIVLRKPKEPPPDEFGKIVEQMTGTEPPPPVTINVVSDPASPRLQPPPPAKGQGMSNQDLIDLIQKHPS